MLNAPHPREQIAALRAQLATDGACRGPSLPFGIEAIDSRLADHGLDSHALHEIAPASPALSDDAAATLLTAGLAARFAGSGGTVLWAVTRFEAKLAAGLDRDPETEGLHSGRKNLSLFPSRSQRTLKEGCSSHSRTLPAINQLYALGVRDDQSAENEI